eukprot:2927422-Amphidinium_carterae.1
MNRRQKGVQSDAFLSVPLILGMRCRVKSRSRAYGTHDVIAVFPSAQKGTVLQSRPVFVERPGKRRSLSKGGPTGYFFSEAVSPQATLGTGSLRPVCGGR